MTRDTSILSGKWGWLWELSKFPFANIDACIKAIIQEAKDLGFRGIIVKEADGTQEWPQFQQMIQPCKDAGLLLAAWIFNYGDDVPGEAKAVIDAFNAGAAFVCLDVEDQYANKTAQAAQMGQLIRAAKPDALLTFAPWCMVNDGIWSSVPYAEVAKYCDAVMPQQYWSDYVPTVDVGLKQSAQELAKFKLPVFPILQAYPGKGYTPTADDYKLAESTCHSLGYIGVSFWEMSAMTADMKTSIKAMNFPIVQPKPSLDKDAAQRFVNMLHQLWFECTPADQAVIEFAADAVRKEAGLSS